MNSIDSSAALALILANSPESESCDDNSFVRRLWDEGDFDSVRYGQIERALAVLSADADAAAEADRHVFAIYRMTAACLAFHNDPQDLYRIDTLDRDQVGDLTTRIWIVFQCYFNRHEPSIDPWPAAGDAAPPGTRR